MTHNFWQDKKNEVDWPKKGNLTSVLMWALTAAIFGFSFFLVATAHTGYGFLALAIFFIIVQIFLSAVRRRQAPTKIEKNQLVFPTMTTIKKINISDIIQIKKINLRPIMFVLLIFSLYGGPESKKSLLNREPIMIRTKNHWYILLINDLKGMTQALAREGKNIA